MFLIWSILTIPKHNIHLFPFFISLQRDDHSCWNFFVDLLRTSDFGAFQFALVCSVICCSDFVSRRDLRFLLTLRVDQLISLILDMIRFAGCFGIMLDFFKQPQASVQIEAVLSFELFGFFWLIRQILFTSVPLYYFDLKSDWLPLLTFAFGSPPEVLLFRYLLFVTIR